MGRSKKKILLIDESVAGLMVGKMILGRDAYDVVTARTRREGLEKAFAEKPDLIVMSAGSRQVGPHDATTCEALRAHEGTRGTPILVVTTRMWSATGPVAGQGESLHPSARREETCDYITKPISGLDLLTKVRSWLGEGPNRRGRA